MGNFTVVWSNFAAYQLEITYQYLIIETNKKLASDQINQLLKATQNLTLFPNSGKLEPSLKNSKKEYRFIVKDHIKIFYTIEHDSTEIRILDLFDSRQNPDKIKRAIDL